MVKISDGIYIKMGWSYVSYIENTKKYVFTIEPMYKSADILYIPNDKSFSRIADTIMSVKWNRDIKYINADIDVKEMPVYEDEAERGTLESTKGAQEILSLDLFDPNAALDESQIREVWYVLDQRFAEGVEGKVEIRHNSVVNGSVFDKITMPALKKNKKAQIVYS